MKKLKNLPHRNKHKFEEISRELLLYGDAGEHQNYADENFLESYRKKLEDHLLYLKKIIRESKTEIKADELVLADFKKGVGGFEAASPKWVQDKAFSCLVVVIYDAEKLL